MKSLRILLCLTAVWLPSARCAVLVKDLYQASVPVESQSAKLRARAAETGLQQVLIKVSGNSSITSLSAIQEQLATANQHIQQFRYKKSSDGKLQLKINFDDKAVQQMLTSSEQGIWGAQRPLLAAWIAVQDKDGHQYIISADSDEANMAKSDANARGLPITLPIADLQEINQSTWSDVWNLKADNLSEVSKQYQTDGLLLAKLQQDTSGEWRATWALFYQSDSFTWDVQGNEMANVVESGLSSVADNLADRYANLDNADNVYAELTVNDVNDVNAYAKVINYLRKLSPVDSVDVISVNANSVAYRLKLTNSVQSLIQALALNPVLKPQSEITDLNHLEYNLAS